MKKLLFLFTVLFTVLSFTACKEDEPIPMVWEFSNYDRDSVSAVYAPDFVNQVTIATPPEYNGEITLKCTNFPQIMLNANTEEGSFKSFKGGFTVTKIDNNTLKITFQPIETADNGVYEFVSVNGKTGNKTGITNMSVGRVRK